MHVSDVTYMQWMSPTMLLLVLALPLVGEASPHGGHLLTRIVAPRFTLELYSNCTAILVDLTATSPPPQAAQGRNGRPSTSATGAV